MSEEAEDQDNVIRSPEIPYVGSIPGAIFPGRSILISGIVEPPSASDHKRFSAPPDDKLVLNSYVSNQWGAEERYANPFEEGKPFTIRIAAFENYFKVAVNGRHVCDYAHRIKAESIQTIAVSGNIRIDYIQYQPALTVGLDGKLLVGNQAEKEERLITVDQPAVPFSFDLLEKGFVSPQSVKFTLTPSLTAVRFNINFMSGQEFFFHFRVDMPQPKVKEAVIRNSTANGNWLTEERHIGKFPFSKEITHDVVVHAYEKSVAVDVDGLPYVKFSYRTGNNPREINQITVDGDVSMVRFVHKTYVKP